MKDDEDEEGWLREDIINSTFCQGISTITIDNSGIRDTDRVKSGCSHLVGNVFRFLERSNVIIESVTVILYLISYSS